LIGFAPAGKPGGGLIRRQQLEAWKAAQPKQPSLFELKDDRRPLAERTAAGVIMSRPFSHSSPMRNCCP